MGWNSFTAFSVSVVEDEVKANADYLASHLAPLGWEYVVVDGMWYEDYGADGTLINDSPRPPLQVDEVGRLLPALTRFPLSTGGAGLAPLAAYVHGLGLKFGLHIMRGIARVAVERNCRIAGTSFRAADIANTNDTCFWYAGMYGVDMTKPGAQAYYDSLIDLYAGWGVDFIKADDMGSVYARAEVEAVAAAIGRSGRPIVLSLVGGDSAFCMEHSEMWRVSGDLNDDWEQVSATFDIAAQSASYAGPGHWPDFDTLPLGHLHLRKWGTGMDPHMTRLSRDEQRTLMTLWCIAQSPLMFAGHLPDNDDWTLSLLTNPAVLAVNQHGTNAREFSRDSNAVVWISNTPDPAARNLALFNLGDTPREITVACTELGLPAACTVCDLWQQQALASVSGNITALVPPHGAVLYRLASV